MTPEQWHKDKVIVYIILAVIAAFLVILYVYTQLTGMPSMPARQESEVNAPGEQTASSSYGAVITLTPQQSAAKTAVVDSFMVQKPQPLTKSQGAAKAAAIEAFENQGK